MTFDHDGGIVEKRADRAVRPYTRSDVPCERPLPLPLGEVAERSEDGEGNHDHTGPLSHLR